MLNHQPFSLFLGFESFSFGSVQYCDSLIHWLESEKWKMKLAPREIEKLGLHNAGYLAQKRLARGLRLNYTEAVALIATQVRTLYTYISYMYMYVCIRLLVCISSELYICWIWLQACKSVCYWTWRTTIWCFSR